MLLKPRYMALRGIYENSNTHPIILSHTAGMSQEDTTVSVLPVSINKEASIVTTDWKEIDGL